MFLYLTEYICLCYFDTMSIARNFNTFGKGQSWSEKVLAADAIWAQLKDALAGQGLSLPATPRRPDVRMILNNISGVDISFSNPGDHSASKEEVIPAAGNSTAAMVMLMGSTLAEQYQNAKTLYDRYDLGTQGLSMAFVNDMKAGKLSAWVSESYGPAPFQSQADKLVDVEWALSGDVSDIIVPERGAHAAFGARAATDETVFLVQMPIFVRGTNTTAELIESTGMNIAVSSDWKTKEETTRPIVSSVAKVYYGGYVDRIPEVTLNAAGDIVRLDLKNGTILSVNPRAGNNSLPPSPPGL